MRREPAEVLYVDDDSSFADMIRTVLEQEADNLRVSTASDVKAGLEAVRTGSIDCVVSDYSMPETDGIEFLREIREEDEDLPFLLLTAKGSEDVASEAISAGVTDYIQKGRGDNHYSLLANRITNAIEQHRASKELERQKRELERLKNRFQSFIRYSPDIITSIDDDGIIRYQSPAVERILGYTQEETIGTEAIDYVHPEDRDDVMAGFYEMAEGESEPPIIHEYRVEHADGSWVWVESIVSTSDELDEGGYVVNSREITDRKRRERELEQKTERLDEFAGIVSHDLQNPLSIASGRLSLARNTCESPETMEHLDSIDDALARMGEIIDASLTLAREGQIVQETEPVELDELADRCFRTVTPQTATLQVTADLTVQADPERLRTLIENLFRNAAEHGGESVTVRIGETETDGFYVADDGPGIPPDKQEAVFEAGYSLAESGNGFGLAIVEEIADAHGWSVEVTDSDEGGARFEFVDVETA